MLKKIKKAVACLLSIMVMLMAIPLSISAEPEEASIGVAAYDNVDFEGTADRTEMNTDKKYRSSGEGYAGMWVHAINNFGQTNPALNGNRQMRIYDSQYFYSVISASGSLFRQLATELDFNRDAVYYYKFNARNNVESVAKYHAAKFYFGDAITVGLEESAAGENPADPSLPASIYPTLEVKGSKLWSADGGMGAKTLTFLLEITTNAEGPETIRLQYADDESSLSLDESAYQLQLEAECGDSKMGYIGLYSITYGCASLGSHEVHSYSIDDIELLRTIESNIISGDNLTDEDIRSAITFLSKIKRGFIYEHYLTIIKDYIYKNGLTDNFKPTLTGTSVEDDDVIIASALESIELAFSSNILEGTGEFSLVDSEGNELFEDAQITENKVKVSFSALSPNESYTLKVKGLTDIIGLPVDDVSVNFYTDFVPIMNITAGSEIETGTVLSWVELEGVECNVTVNGIQITNGGKLIGSGETVIVITATNEAGIEKNQEIRITLIDAYAPVASDVKVVSGNAGILNGTFEFSDKNGDEKGSCIYAWYYTDKDGKNPTVIDGAESDTYTVSEADYNKYIVFEVTPVSLTGGNHVGLPVKSLPYAAPHNPIARDVKLKGTPILGEKLKVDFVFYDENGDKAGTHKYAWYTSDTKDAEKGSLTTILGAESSEFEITEETMEIVTGKYITASIIPVSENAPTDGTLVHTPSLLGPTAPVVSNAKIIGTATVGSKLTGDYVFFDANLDEEGDSVIEWIDRSSGNVLATGRTITVTSAMAGKNIYLRVIGKSIYAPYESNQVISEAVTIASSSPSSSGRGSKGFSISGSSSGSIKSSVQPITPPSVVPPPETNKLLNDIKGHWAEEAIAALYDKNILSGTGNGTYEPDRTVTRSEIVKMLMSCDEVKTAEYNGIFDDVDKNDWFAGFVQAAFDKGLLSADVYFRPNDGVTRQEAAKLIAMFKVLEFAETNPKYSDVDSISEWAMPYVAAVTEGGFMNGDDLGNFMPLKQLTRAEAATIIWRLIK